MKYLILLIISAFASNLATCQEYRISYEGLPELYETVDISLEQNNQSGDYTTITGNFKIATEDGEINGHQLAFDRAHIHRKSGNIEVIVTQKKQTQTVQLSLPILKEIRFNLYADSIKPVLNYYLNVEGVFSNNKVYPLDSNFITITSDNGTVQGNEWIKPNNINFDSVNFVAICKYDSTITSSTKVYIKKLVAD